MANTVAYVGNRTESQNEVMEEYYVGNQQAALGTVGMDMPEPGGGGLVYDVFFANLLCATVVDDVVSVPGVTTMSENGTVYCDTGLANPGSGGQAIIQVNSQTGLISISGTSTAATAMKLHALGYKNQSTNLSVALKAFQRDNGISQTGKIGTLTTNALDEKVRNLRIWNIEKKYEIYSQDSVSGRQQAALGTMGSDTPEPGGEGVGVVVFNYLERTCTYYWTVDGVSGSNTVSWENCFSLAGNDSIEGIVNFQLGTTGGGTSVIATKLALLGYMSGQSKMAPWPPTNIAEEIKAFQRDNGISQTGTAGPLTTAALDAKAANLRAKLVGAKYWVSSNDPTDDPEAEIFYRYPEE